MTPAQAQSRLRADQIEALRAFAEAVLGEAYEFGGGDIDGGWLQEKGVEIGVLVKVPVKEPCSDEHCACAEWDEFPQECHRIAPFVLGRETPPADFDVDDLIADGEPGL